MDHVVIIYLYLHVGKEVMYIVKTREGSSGSPLLYSAAGSIQCLIVMGVHVRGAPDKDPPYKVAAVLTQDFF